MRNEKRKSREQLELEIQQDFLKKLPELSIGWQPPTFAVELNMSFIVAMINETLSKFKGDLHWIEFYRLRGINPDSEKYILPSSLFADAMGEKREEYERKKRVLDEHMAQALWPIIKSGKRPFGFGIKRLMKKARGAFSIVVDWEKEAWYWALAYIYRDWYSYTVKNYYHADGVEEEAIDILYGIDSRRPEWFNRQCLNWWLNSQRILLNPSEVEELYFQAGFHMDGA